MAGIPTEATRRRYGKAHRIRNRTAQHVLIWFLSIGLLLLANGTRAAEIVVGEGTPYPQPSDAAPVVRPGDRVRILPGTYYDCAVWSVDGIEIIGSGETTRITDRICQGKAVFVVTGNDVVIRDLTLARARSLDGNAAGIRAEGRNLTLRNLLIEDNQDGVLAPGLQPGGIMRVEDCVFRANGTNDSESITGALRVGPIDRLIVARTRFLDGRGESVIASAALSTEMADAVVDAIADGRGPTIRIEGGVRITASTIAAGAGPRGYRAAILALPTGDIVQRVIQDSRLQGDGILLLNWSGEEARLAGNAVGPQAVAESSDGAWMNWLRGTARSVVDALRGAVRDAFRTLKAIARSILRPESQQAAAPHPMAGPVPTARF